MARYKGVRPYESGKRMKIINDRSNDAGGFGKNLASHNQ